MKPGSSSCSGTTGPSGRSRPSTFCARTFTPPPAGCSSISQANSNPGASRSRRRYGLLRHGSSGGNFAYVDARYADFNFVGGSFSGNTPPNVPRIVANAGASYRFFTPWPVEVGITGRHVGDRYNTDANVVTMKAYTVADVYAFVDIPKTVFNAVDQARLTFRVRNIADKRYAIWGDPFYPDQILLGAPRTYELSAAFRW